MPFPAHAPNNRLTSRKARRRRARVPRSLPKLGISTSNPNPALNELTLDLDSDHAGTLHVLVYDAAGRRVQEREYEKESGHFLTRLSVGDLPPGLYRLQVMEGDRRTIKSFVRM